MSFLFAAQGVASAAGAHTDSRVSRYVRLVTCHELPKLTVMCLLLSAALSLFAADANSRPGSPAREVNPSVQPASANSKKDDAAITIVEFTDFACPYCAQMVSVIDELSRAYPGKIKVIVRDFPLAIHTGSELAHEASLAAKAQGKYWEMFRILFANQKHLSRADLLDYAKQIGLNIPRFEKALDTHEYQPVVRESIAEGQAYGVNATPTFFLNGQQLSGVRSLDFMKAKVQAAIGTVSPSDDSQSTVATNSPVRGSPDAPVTIVEYADFQCPFCAKAENTLNLLLREYPGKVNLVFKSFPLDFHPDSMLAHRAAMAAGQQGKFWEMHDLIFSQQKSIKRDDLFAMAKSLGLDMNRFSADISSPKLLAVIESERAEGKRTRVNGTPTFYVDGQEMLGAIGSSQFEAMIDKSLRAKGIETTKTPVAADGGPARGPEHAAVTVLWYSDVTSPLAVSAAKLVDQVLDAYPADVRVIFKNRPLEFHHDAELAHEALMAAAAQGKFWAMHRVLLEHQNALTAQDLVDYAGKAGLDSQKFFSELTSGAYRDQVQRDVMQAHESGINGVPVFFVNGKRLDGVQTFSSFKAILEEQIQRGRVAAVRE